MKTQMQIITTKGIVQKGNKILSIKDTSGNWEFPGGRLDFGETPEHALAREFNEELQVKDVHIEKLIHAWTFVINSEDNDRQYVVLVYTCNILDQNLRCSDEHQEIRWFTKMELLNLPMRDGYKEAISRL